MDSVKQTRKRSPSPPTKKQQRSPSPTQITKRSVSPTTKNPRSPSPIKRSPSPTKITKRSASPTKQSRSPSPTKIRQVKGGYDYQQSSRTMPTNPINIRQNFSSESEQGLNKLANLLMFGGYSCISMGSYFDRDDIGLYGMAHFFKWCSTETFHCVRLLMDYVVLRGGKVFFDKISKPNKNEWKSPLEALEFYLDMKQVIYDQVLQIHKTSSSSVGSSCQQSEQQSTEDQTQTDGHLNDFLETVILRPLVACNRQLIVLISNLKRVGPNLGEYQFNIHLEQLLQNLMRDPNLSYLVHGGIDVGTMYKVPRQTPIDFSSILSHVMTTTPQWTHTNLNDIISHLFAHLNIGDMARFKNIY